jgi:predicted metal-dependent hydrolase
MHKRWGSCTKAGKIILNTELIKAPKANNECVAIQELCHLAHHNHTKEFYALQNKLSPKWEKWKEKLEQALSSNKITSVLN